MITAIGTLGAVNASAHTTIGVAIATCAHRGDDARIVHRQAAALLAAGHRVTLIAPAPDTHDSDPVGLERIATRRAIGRRRLRAWWELRRHLDRRVAVGDIDLVIIHDPELVAVVALVAPRRADSTGRHRIPVVWDVHEDYAASVRDRAWIPAALRPLMGRAVSAIERLAARRTTLIAAEDAYLDHLGAVPVIPNSAWVPEHPAPYRADERARVVYVGRISPARGAREMIEIGKRLRARRDGIDLVLVGAVDDDLRHELEAAAAEGALIWTGPLPNPEALAHLNGALAGLCLLHDAANYRISQPTKITEYLAAGVPAIASALPLAARLIDASGGGYVVGCVGDHPGDHRADGGDGGDTHVAPAVIVERSLAAIDELANDPERRRRMGADGHDYVARHHNWANDAAAFTALIERLAIAGRRPAR